MANIDIQIQGNDIHAEFAQGSSATILENVPLILDPLTLSYSNLGTFCDYEMTIDNISGLSYYDILHNGKNSRFIAEGVGSCDITLTVNDNQGNFDSTIITITII